MAYAIEAGLDSAIMDPCNTDMMSAIYACEALCMKDKGGRKYNRASSALSLRIWRIPALMSVGFSFS